MAGPEPRHGARRDGEFIPVRVESRADKFDAKLREGVWFGFDSRTDENITDTSYGVYRASTIKGVPEDKRWDSAKVVAVLEMFWDNLVIFVNDYLISF